MKKSVAILAASGLVALSLTGCGNGNGADSQQSVKALEEKIVALEKENKDLKAQLDKGASTQAPNDQDKKPEQTGTEEVAPANAPLDENKVIEVNKAKKVEDFAELTIKGAKFGKKISPPNPGSFYTYYEVKDASNIYFDVVIKVKSLLKEGKSADEFASVKVIYDGQYEYSAFSTLEEGGGSDFTYTNINSIEPLKSETLHFIAEVPAEIAKDKKPIKVIVSANGQEYTYTYR